jgi:hypothetical protein
MIWLALMLLFVEDLKHMYGLKLQILVVLSIPFALRVGLEMLATSLTLRG